MAAAALVAPPVWEDPLQLAGREGGWKVCFAPGFTWDFTGVGELPGVGGEAGWQRGGTVLSREGPFGLANKG